MLNKAKRAFTNARLWAGRRQFTAKQVALALLFAVMAGGLIQAIANAEEWHNSERLGAVRNAAPTAIGLPAQPPVSIYHGIPARIHVGFWKASPPTLWV